MYTNTTKPQTHNHIDHTNDTIVIAATKNEDQKTMFCNHKTPCTDNP